MTVRPRNEVSRYENTASTMREVKGRSFFARLAGPGLLMLLTVTALLAASPAAAQCNPFITDCDGTPTAGPDIGMSPDGGSWTVDSGTVTVPVSIYMTDADGLNASTRDVRLWSGQSNVPVTLTWTINAEGTSGSLRGNLELSTAGDNVLVAQISDRLGNAGTASATFRLSFTEPGLPIVSLDPHHSEFRNTAQGAFVLGYAAPSYTSMDTARSVGLMYTSEQARITGFVQVDARPDPANAAAVVAMSLRIEQWTADGQGRHALVGKESFYAKGDGSPQRLAVHWLMGENVPTGAYKYWAVVRAYRTATAWTERRLPVRVLVVNEKASRYGAGWSLAGVQRLHSTADGLLLNEGNGVARFFKGGSSNGMCTGACTYETPAGDFTVLTYRPDSATWARTYPDGSQAIFDYSGLMTGVRDRFGHGTAYEWQQVYAGGPWVLSRVVDWVGKASTLAYANGYLASITTAGRVVNFAYNSANQLTSISGPPNLKATYNASGQLLEYTTDFSTGSVTDAGATSNLTYDEFRQLRTFSAAAVTANGKLQQPKTAFRSLPGRTAPSPNVANNFTSPAPAVPSAAVTVEVTDPRLHVTRISVDRYGNATKTVDAEGRTTVMTWTADGLPATVVTPTQHSGYAWNEKGQPLVQTVGDSVVFEASYTADGLPEFVASGGTALWYAYDSERRLDRSWPGKKEDEQRTATKYEYNGRHQLIKAVGPKGEIAEWGYEGNDWRNADYVKITREDRTILTTNYTYDARSRTATVTNPLGEKVTTEYDDYDRIVKVIDPKGGWTVYEYTGPHLTRVTDPGSRVFKFTYNALGWLESEQFPGDRTSRTYEYTADGLVLSVTNRNGDKVTFAYDGSHLLRTRTADGITTTIQRPDPFTTIIENDQSVVTSSVHASTGKLNAISSTLAGRVFEIKRAYDSTYFLRDIGFDLNTILNGALQRTDKVRYLVDFQPSDSSLRSTYQIEDMSGAKTVMGFDASGRPVKTTFPNNVTQYNWFTTDGRLDSTTFSASGVNQRLGATFTYDALNRLSTRTSRLEDFQWRYEYDGVGQVTKYAKFRKGTLSGCDPSFEDCPVTWLPTALEEYTYDESGNRTDRGAATELGGSNRYTDFDTFAFTYDPEGNLTRKWKSGFDQRFTWNTLGQLTSVTTNGSTVTYGYDGLGRRVKRTEGSTTRYYLYDGDDLLMEIDQNGNAIHTYTHWPGVDNPHSVRVTSYGQNYMYYYTTERPGHVTGLLSTYGEVAGEHKYKPFGEVESSVDEAGQPLRFMGRELDFTTQLYYVRNRWYDPTIARFISQDPIGMGGGLNAYAYVGNDPMNRRDPSGLRSEGGGDPVPIDWCTLFPKLTVCGGDKKPVQLDELVVTATMQYFAGGPSDAYAPLRGYTGERHGPVIGPAGGPAGLPPGEPNSFKRQIETLDCMWSGGWSAGVATVKAVGAAVGTAAVGTVMGAGVLIGIDARSGVTGDAAELGEGAGRRAGRWVVGSATKAVSWVARRAHPYAMAGGLALGGAALYSYCYDSAGDFDNLP